MQHPPRVPLVQFPDVVILLADEVVLRRHQEYSLAKAGDVAAAVSLVGELVSEAGIVAIRDLIAASSESRLPVLVSAHAYEQHGVNAIPSALAKFLSEHLELPFETGIVQSNIVWHTGASGFGRLARQARFAGEVQGNREYLLVDDFIGQGGTMANLRGWIESQRGQVVGAVALSGKPYSAKLQPTEEQLHELRQRHGEGLEEWWRQRFGHVFNCLTQSEARYLTRSPDAGRIRDRIIAEKQAGSL